MRFSDIYGMMTAIAFDHNYADIGGLSAQTTLSSTHLTLPNSPPSSAAVVPADFVGFGFETPFLNDYTNEFSENLINSVADRMSKPPVIRIGGTSGDMVLFDPNQAADRLCLHGDCPNGTEATFSLGPTYFEGFKRFKRSRITFQAPFGNPVDPDSLEYVCRAYEALGPDRLAAIAIGNEVDVYEKTATAYVDAASRLEEEITKLLKLTGPNGHIFEVLDLSFISVASQSPFTLSEAFEAGLNKNGLATCAAEHYYQVASVSNLQIDLMNHTAIEHKFLNYNKSIHHLQSHATIPYVISETGSALGGPLKYSASFGACLWYVDLQLYAMSMGVARVAGTQRPIAQHSLWLPVVTPLNAAPRVQAPFYAQPLVADFIGVTAAPRRVVNVDLRSDVLSAYAVYEGDELRRVALLNLREWNEGGGVQRGRQSFSLGVPDGLSSVAVETLHSGAGAQALGYDVNVSQNITWAGEQWSFRIDRGRGHRSTTARTILKVEDGVAVVGVPDSEAVIVYML